MSIPDQDGLVVFGGAFNPPHRTHRKLLEAALAALPVQGAIVIPSGRHPHKRDQDMAADHARLALCEIAFGDLPKVTVSPLEFDREGPTYTVDTLREIRRAHPNTRLFFLMGSDNLGILDSWHDHHALLRAATFVTYPRRGHPIERQALAGLDLSPVEIDELLAWTLDVEADEVSATAIRAALRRGETPDQLSEPVAEKIRALGLYQANASSGSGAGVADPSSHE